MPPGSGSHELQACFVDSTGSGFGESAVQAMRTTDEQTKANKRESLVGRLRVGLGTSRVNAEARRVSQKVGPVVARGERNIDAVAPIGVGRLRAGSGPRRFNATQSSCGQHVRHDRCA